MERCFLPFIGHVDFQALSSAQTAHCLNRVNLRTVLMLTNLDKSIVEGRPTIFIATVNVYPQFNQNLLDFKCSVSSGAGKVDGVMKQISALVVNVIDLSSMVCDKSGNLGSTPPNHRVFQSRQATGVHLINIGTHVEEFVSLL